VDPEPFFIEIEGAVRVVEKISLSIRNLERTTAIARARTTQLARATRLRYPEASTTALYMQGLLDQASLNMPGLRPSHDFDSDSPASPSFEDRIRVLYAQAHAILAAASTFCENAKGLDRDARLWGAYDAVATADYRAPIPPEVQANPKSLSSSMS
jgi:hypothetical protein